LSQEGKDLAGDDPYIVRNGPFRELVISTPDQMQEFLRKDYKGTLYWDARLVPLQKLRAIKPFPP
jgi:hypothetical protein